ncbi:MAG: hypothetical protein PSU94_04670 [Lacunisphaera sp.]|nr:hypothetical protein [Lacunisphaera sp.]
MPSEPPDPPRKDYGFKDRAFKRDNSPAAGQPPMPTAKELAMMAGPAVPTAIRTTTPKPDDPNDVHALLQQNRAVENKLGLNQVEIKQVKSRRTRDYWLLLGLSELLLGLIVWQGRGNPMVFVSAFAGMVLVGVSITWIMWQIMDRY